METSVTSRHAIEKCVRRQPEDIDGPKHVVSGYDSADRFLCPGNKSPGLAAASLTSAEEAHAIADLSRENKTSMLTCNDHCLLPGERLEPRPCRGNPFLTAAADPVNSTTGRTRKTLRRTKGPSP